MQLDCQYNRYYFFTNVTYRCNYYCSCNYIYCYPTTIIKTTITMVRVLTMTVATLARLIEGLRARPVDEPPQSASAHAAAPAAMRWQGDEPVDDAAVPAPAPAAPPQAQHTGHIHLARTGSLLQISLGPPLHASST